MDGKFFAPSPRLLELAIRGGGCGCGVLFGDDIHSGSSLLNEITTAKQGAVGVHESVGVLDLKFYEYYLWFGAKSSARLGEATHASGLLFFCAEKNCGGVRFNPS